MVLGVPKETRPGEIRVAATPESIKKLVKRGFHVQVERGAGVTARYTDELYRAAGAEIVEKSGALAAPVVLKVLKPSPQEILRLTKGAMLLCFGEPYLKDGTFEKLAEVGVDTIAMELIPRT